MPIAIQKHMLEHADGKEGGRGGVIINYNCEDFNCEDGLIELKGQKKPVKLPRLLTGHVDIVQIRNGSVHLLDYKPNAAKEKPIEQLTWYALALSRLTGLRLYEFKCAWFDEKDYFEFYPLHAVKKLSDKKRSKKVWLKRKGMVEIPKDNVVKMI